MAAVLVDFENVCTTDGLKGMEYLNENDTLIIFYSQCCEKVRAEYIEMIEKCKCEFKTYKLARTGKNALDFYIAVECGRLSAVGETQICIISKDKGFRAVSDYFSSISDIEHIAVQLAPNIESALLLLTASEDAERKRLIKEKSKLLNIASEQARINEHRKFISKIIEAFRGTEYEMRTDDILKFIDNAEMRTPKSLYTGSLHEFGREDGMGIYKVLRRVV